MKLFLILISAIATLVSSQPSVASLPACAGPCIDSGIAATGCQLSDIHCFCTATQFLRTIAPCVLANCSVADQQATQIAAQKICDAATPPVELPPFASLLNSTSSSVSASASGTSSSTAASSSAAAATSHSSASGRIEGDVRIMMAIAAMAGVVAIAFFAV